MKRYSVLIVAALPLEIQSLKKTFTSLDTQGLQFLYLGTGVGNYNVVYELQKYLQHHHVDFICNIGVCGKVSDNTSRDMFQVVRIKNFSNSKESIPPIYVNTGNLQSIGCSEKVITNPSDMKNEQYVDMESYGIDFIAKKEQIAHCIVKIPFDTVSPESKRVSKSDIQELITSQDYSSLIEQIHTWCQRNIQELPNWDFYKKHFRLTVTETEMFKKCYYKLTAYEINFSSFFEQHKHLSKKEFFQQVENLKY